MSSESAAQGVDVNQIEGEPAKSICVDQTDISLVFFYFHLKNLTCFFYRPKKCFFFCFFQKATTVHSEYQQICIDKNVGPRNARFSSAVSKCSPTEISLSKWKQSWLSYASYVSCDFVHWLSSIHRNGENKL